MRLLEVRLDLWLWYARFFKTRSKAQKAIEEGRVTRNGRVAGRNAEDVKIGDHLSLDFGKTVREVRVRTMAERRGPAPEARAMYDSADETKIW